MLYINFLQQEIYHQQNFRQKSRLLAQIYYKLLKKKFNLKTKFNNIIQLKVQPNERWGQT